MNEDPGAPFIPSRPEEQSLPPAPWRVFGTRSYFRLWLAPVTSSTGDWIGLIAVLAIAAWISNNSGAAVGLVMLARVTLAAGWWARYSIGHARRMQRTGTTPGPAGAGAI